MSLGTPSRDRKKTTVVPAPSSKKSSTTSAKSGVKSDKSSKPGKNDAKDAKPASKSIKDRKPAIDTEKAPKNAKTSKEPPKIHKTPKKEPPPKPVKAIKPPPPPEEEIYEDDFEDYSDDFESEKSDSASSPPSVKRKSSIPAPEPIREEKMQKSAPEATKAVVPELDEDEVEDLPLGIPEDTPMLRRLATSQGRREPPPPPPKAPAPRRESRVLSATERKIDFTSAQTYDIVALSNNERRYQKLRELITFDFQKFVILDKPPVKDYDFYMQLFGDRGKMQAASQTRDDDIAQSVQTEQPVQRTVWTQAPAAIGGDWGGEEGSRKYEDDGMSIFRENHLENERLKKFMETASQVILDLMASRRRGGKLLDLGERSDQAFSAGTHSLKLQPLSNKYKCTALAKDDRGNQTITAAFLVEQSVATDVEGRSLIVETIVDSSRPPERLFLCDAEVSTMCYSPDGSALYVGMKDGSVAAFDLLESDLSFDSRIPWIDSQVDIVLRRPSFDTSFLIAALTSDGATPIVYMHASNSQLAVLDSSATLYLYGVQRDDSPRLGKTAGARLSLTLTAIIKPDSAVLKSANQPTPLIATCMAVAGDGQYVVESFGEITALRASPHDKNMLVAGLSTGSIQLIRLDQAAPIMILTPPTSIRFPVTSVEWSPTSNTGFYSWHGGVKILFWDISIGSSPITTSDLISPILPGVTITWLESSDHRVGFMAQAATDGSVEIHALEPPRNNKMRIGSAVRSFQ